MPWTKSDVDRFKEGLTDSQKEQWVAIANDVLQRCLDDGGNQDECEASAIRQANGAINNNNMKNFTRLNNNYRIRHEEHDGRKHIVIPCTMMVEGVHAGSHGPIYHSIDELGKYPAAWDGRPIVINHPTDEDGNPISANNPDVMDRESVGKIFNTHVEGTKLTAEAWLDEQRLSQVSPQAKQYVESQKPLSVSVGVFTDEEKSNGNWQGESYKAVAYNHRPDHLALLPGEHQEGACSIADGCGLGFYKKKGGKNEMSKRKRKDVEVYAINDEARTPQYDGTTSGNWSRPDFSQYVNAYFDKHPDAGDEKPSDVDGASQALKNWIASLTLLGNADADNFRDLSFFPVVEPSSMNMSENALDSVLSGRGEGADIEGYAKESAQNKARQLLEKEFDRDLQDNSLTLEQMKEKLENNGYVVNKNGGNMTKKEKVAKIINNNENFSDKDRQSLEAMEDKYLDELVPKDGDQPCCPEKVDALINNESTKFTKEDRDKLLQLDEATLDKLQPEQSTRKRKDDPQNNNNEDKEKEAKEQIKKIFSQYQDPEKFIDEMIPGGNLKGTLKNSLNVYKENRKNMIDQITNHNSKWTEEELQQFDDNVLQKLHDSIVPQQTNYAGIGGGEDIEVNVDDGYDMIPENLLQKYQEQNNGQK
jgi:hypothetical protein